MGNPTLEPSTITLASYTGDASSVEGYLDIQMYIHDTDVSHRFYVLRQGHGNTLVLLDYHGNATTMDYHPRRRKASLTKSIRRNSFNLSWELNFTQKRKPKNPNQPKPELQIHERIDPQENAASVATKNANSDQHSQAQ